MKYLKMLGLAAVAAMALTAFLAASASATEIYSNGVTQGAGTTIESTLKATTSALLKDTGGSTNDTCTGSTVSGKTANAGGSGVNVTGSISSLAFTGCTHTTDPLKNADGTFGKLELKWTSGTNATVISKESRVTVQSTVFGISCTANTGEGTTLGTLATAAGTNAVMTINAVINMGAFCGDSTWTGTYIVTKPANMTVEDK
jgi:hypothetical protein